MEIPGYEDTFFDGIEDDIKERFKKAKQEFEDKKAAAIARNEKINTTERSNQRAQFISKCIDMQNNKHNAEHHPSPLAEDTIIDIDK